MESLIKMAFGAEIFRPRLALLFIIGLYCSFGFSDLCMAFEGDAGPAHAGTRVDAAIDQLGAPAYLERESATRELLNRGSAVIPQLETALRSAKGEVRYRIRSIFDRQLRSSDMITRQAAQQALIRIATGKDNASSRWARSLLAPPGLPIPVPGTSPSPVEKQG